MIKPWDITEIRDQKAEKEPKMTLKRSCQYVKKKNDIVKAK